MNINNLVILKNKLLILLRKCKNHLLTKERENSVRFNERIKLSYIAWWKEAASDLSASFIEEKGGVLRLEKNEIYTFIKNNFVMLDSLVQLDMAGDKIATYDILEKLNIPVPCYLEYSIEELERPKQLIEKKDKHFVVKPCFGTGGGIGVTTRISTFKQLKKASFIAASFCPRILIEEFITGDSYRLLYLNGQFIDAIRRDFPVVVGDGEKSIEQLVGDVNHFRLENKMIQSVFPLVIDMDLIQTLKSQSMNLSTILPKGKEIKVKTVINQNSRNENHRVSDQVNPEIIAQGAKIVNYLGLKLAGVDVITSDITVPLENVSGYINEINTTPGLHIHKMVSSSSASSDVFNKILAHLLNNGIHING